MKVLGKTFRYMMLTSASLFVAVAGYNSYKFNHVSELHNGLNIKLTKRLDETYGQVKFGRMAASLRKINTDWAKEEADKKLIQNVNKVVREKFKPLLKTKKLAAAKPAPAPAIANDLDLELTGGIFNKKPLKEGVDYSGSAKIVDGIIEEITVSLPGDKDFTINTRERMVGNVFQYEDTKTREIKSGLFYEVKKGTYMITLTDDSQYGGIRLQFTAPNAAEIQDNKNDDQQNWAMNQQNEEQEDSYGYNYENEEEPSYEEEAKEDSYQARKYDDIKKTTSPYSHSFGT